MNEQMNTRKKKPGTFSLSLLIVSEQLKLRGRLEDARHGVLSVGKTLHLGTSSRLCKLFIGTAPSTTTTAITMKSTYKPISTHWKTIQRGDISVCVHLYIERKMCMTCTQWKIAWKIMVNKRWKMITVNNRRISIILIPKHMNNNFIIIPYQSP